MRTTPRREACVTDLPIKRAARLSNCGTLRFTLDRIWGDGPTVCFCGLNPSTADHLVDDPTVKRWTHFARSWGYAGFRALNLYPYRSPSPGECRRWADWQN